MAMFNTPQDPRSCENVECFHRRDRGTAKTAQKGVVTSHLDRGKAMSEYDLVRLMGVMLFLLVSMPYSDIKRDAVIVSENAI